LERGWVKLVIEKKSDNDLTINHFIPPDSAASVNERRRVKQENLTQGLDALIGDGGGGRVLMEKLLAAAG
jgi:hypothetical protein